MYLLDKNLVFPSPEMAEEDGLLAIGGNLSADRLLLAYLSGIFPWYNEGEPILWWSPDPRFVLFPEKLKISKSMKAVLKNGKFSFTINKAFSEVINNCSDAKRKGQGGTWITPAMKRAFLKLHRLGYAHSAETWLDGKLVGGLYGVLIGNMFCGESMFATESNASKFAFISYVQHLEKEGIALIDCQVHTDHLESLGACMIERKKFLEILNKATACIYKRHKQSLFIYPPFM